MRSVNLLAITVLSMMLAGCPETGTGSPASPLAGDWKTPTPDNAQVVLTFDDAGNLVQLTGTTPDGQSQTRSITGAVTVIDGEMITIRIPTDTGEIVLEGMLSSTGNMFIGVLSGEFIVSEDLDIRLAQGEVRIDREADDDDNLNGNDNSDDGNANDNVDDDNLNDNSDDDDDNANDNSDDDNANDNSDDDNTNDNTGDDNVNDNSDDDNLNDNVDDDNLNDNVDDDDNLNANDNSDDDNSNDNSDDDDDNLNDNADDDM